MMSRSFRISMLLLSTCALTAMAEAPRISLSNQTWPPYFYADPESPPGLAREILDECVPAAGFRPYFSPVPVDLMFRGLQSGAVDAHILSFRSEREVFLVYGDEPLFVDGYRPVVLAGRDLVIESLDDLDPLTVGHLRGLTYTPEYHDYVDRRSAEGQLVVAESNHELLRMLLDGRVDVFVSLVSTTRQTARDLDAADRISILDLDLKTSAYRLAVSRASKRITDPEAFLAAVDRCIVEMKRDGRYDALNEKYGLAGTTPVSTSRTRP